MNKSINFFTDYKNIKMKKYSQNATKSIFSIFRLVILISIGFVILYPLFYMIITSVQSKHAFLNSSRVWIPNSFSIKENFSFAFEALDYGKSLISTLKYEVLSAIIQVCSCAFAAYGFARFKFKEKGILLIILFLTILIPDMMLLIPRMINYSHLDFLGVLGLFNKIADVDLRPNILNSGWVFWLPSMFGVGLKSGILIYIYIQFFKSLPKELEEAAWVDGAGPFKTFLSIALPSSGVVILTVTIFSLIWHWNDSLLSGIYLTENYPLAVNLKMMPTALSKYNILISARNPESMAYLMAGCVLFITPMLVLYMFVQRGFIESIDRVGITG